MTRTTQLFPLVVAAVAVSFLSAAAASNTTTSSLQSLLAEASQWRETHLRDPSSHPGGGAAHVGVRPNTVVAWALSFLAASVSSAGGVGGGSLFLPILNLVAGLSLKRATAYSSFMVTGGADSNVLYNLACTGMAGRGGGRLIDYDIALLFQPCLLLGVSIGVVCNVVFPECLITALFSLFLAFATFKTYGAGVRRWRAETAELGRMPPDAVSGAAAEEALLGRNASGGRRCQWVDLAVLITVWLCFFVMHLFIGGEGAKV